LSGTTDSWVIILKHWQFLFRCRQLTSVNNVARSSYWYGGRWRAAKMYT
jgi:hypothetical protein